MPGVFISYAREDLEFVTRLHDGLAAAARDPAWDQDHGVVPFGAMYEAEVSAAITASDKLVFVLTPASLASEPCRWEISRAQESGKQIIPLLRVPLAEDVPIPDAVGKRNWIFFTGDSQAEFDRAFGQLIQALDTDLDWAHVHTRLQMRAEEWAGSESDKSKLLRGTDLRNAESWLAGEAEHPATPPTTVQRQYLTASRRAATRLARIVRGALAGGMAGALALAAYAFVQRAQAVAEKNQAVFNQTTAEAAQLARTSTSLAANLNAAAYDMKATASIRSRLIEAENTPLATPLHAGRVPVQAVAFSPRGQVLATGDHSGVVQLWQVTNPDHPRLLAVEKAAEKVGAGETVTSLAFSPNGQLLAAGVGGGGSRGLVTLWSVTNPSRPRLVRQLTNAGRYTVFSVAFSPDGTYLATGDGNGTGIVYDLAHLPEVLSLAPFRVSRAVNAASRVAFSPDGKLLAMGTTDGVLRMWNFANPLSPRSLGELQASGGIIDSIAFNSDGTVLAAGQFERGHQALERQRACSCLAVVATAGDRFSRSGVASLRRQRLAHGQRQRGRLDSVLERRIP